MPFTFAVCSMFMSMLFGNITVNAADTSVTVPLEFMPTQAIIGNFNGDGLDDIAVTGSSLFVVPQLEVIIAGQTTGVVSTVGLVPSFTYMAAADFDGDGSDEIAVSIQKTKEIEVFKYTGGTLVNTTVTPIYLTAGTSPFNTIATGNFNGHQGIVALSSAQIAIVNGTGSNSSFSSPTYISLPATATGLYTIFTEDVNGSGKDSLVVISRDNNQVYVYLNNGSGVFHSTPSSTYSVGGAPIFAAFGDFNGNGSLDMAVVNSSAGTVTILLNNGNGGFTIGNSYSVGAQGPVGIIANDINDDGKLDLQIVNQSSSLYSILLGNGDGTFGNLSTGPTGSSPFSIAGYRTPSQPLALIFANLNMNTLNIITPSISSTGAPTNLSGRQVYNKFLSQTDIINILKWSAPTGTSPVSYKIYRDAALTQLIETVPGSQTQYKDHNRRKKVVYTYYVVAVFSSGSTSAPGLIVVTPK